MRADHQQLRVTGAGELGQAELVVAHLFPVKRECGLGGLDLSGTLS